MHSAARTHIDHSIDFNEVGDGYFSTMGTRLLAGREFTTDDHDRSICVVNESAAHTLFPGGAALQETVMAKGEDDRDVLAATCRIVGLVEDAHYANLRDPAPPTIYFPIAQQPSPAAYTQHGLHDPRAERRRSHRRIPRHAGPLRAGHRHHDLPAVAGSGRSIARQRAPPRHPHHRIRRHRAAAERHRHLWAACPAGAGAHPEFGVRLAVGATRGHLLKIVLGDALRMVVVGSACGLALASIGYIFIRRFLYGTSPADFASPSLPSPSLSPSRFSPQPSRGAAPPRSILSRLSAPNRAAPHHDSSAARVVGSLRTIRTKSGDRE